MTRLATDTLSEERSDLIFSEVPIRIVTCEAVLITGHVSNLSVAEDTEFDQNLDGSLAGDGFPRMCMGIALKPNRVF